MRGLLSCAMTAILAAAGAVDAQSLPARQSRDKAPPDKVRVYTPPRTPWGDPDLQGKWPSTDMVGVPIQRDPRFGHRNVLTEAEFRERRDQSARQKALDQADFDLAAATSSPGGEVGGPVAPPPHWLERGKPQYQASLIVDPSDGRIPAQTPEARRRAAAIREARENRGPADSYTDRSLYDRCITRGLTGSVLPAIYNNGNEIVQAPGYVAFRNEMIHETRVIPLDGRPPVGPAIKMWMGDSRGRWEGDSLVVETRNFTNRTAIGLNGVFGDVHSEHLTVTERFTRVSEDTIVYEITIDDPKTWVRPWTLRFPLKRDDDYGFYEYACHEGNYSMFNILSGARADDLAANEAAARRQGRAP